jgi:hypothetical protein
MKRKEEAVKEEREEAAKRKKMLESKWSSTEDSLDGLNGDVTSIGSLLMIKDNDNLFSSLPGRRSFKGFNPYIERQYAILIDTNKTKSSSKERSTLTTITDEEMAERYANLISLPRGPNQGRAKEGWKK